MPDVISPQTALALSATDWISLLGLGLIVGALGQSVRIVVGLNKRHAAGAAAGSIGRRLNPARLYISILIGALAGAVAALVVCELAREPSAAMVFTIEEVLGLAAAGYAGADFIEGVMARFAPNAGTHEDADDQ